MCWNRLPSTGLPVRNCFILWTMIYSLNILEIAPFILWICRVPCLRVACSSCNQGEGAASQREFDQRRTCERAASWTLQLWWFVWRMQRRRSCRHGENEGRDAGGMDSTAACTRFRCLFSIWRCGEWSEPNSRTLINFIYTEKSWDLKNCFFKFRWSQGLSVCQVEIWQTLFWKPASAQSSG